MDTCSIFVGLNFPVVVEKPESDLKCAATEVKTPDLHKSVSVSEDETESDEGSKVNNSATSISNRKLNKSTPTSLFNTPESLPSPIQRKIKKKTFLKMQT